MKNVKIVVTSVLLFILFLTGCKKFVEVDSPKTSVSIKNIFNNDVTAVGALTALYVNLSLGNITGGGELTSLSCITSLSSDDLSLYSDNDVTLSAYFKNKLNNSNVGISDYWSITFKRIYVVNSAIEGLSVSTNLTPSVKQQLLGEAKFMRAFYYFYLVNLYGDVPLVLGTDYTINALLEKSSKVNVYNQIVKDLIDAQSLLSDKYLKGDGVTPYSDGTEERVRPTKWAATALLSRTYLYQKDWINAEMQATIVLNNTIQYRIENINNAFLKNNKEAIWQIQPVLSSKNTLDAETFIIPEAGVSDLNPVYLSHELMKNFKIEDKRYNNWVNSVTVNDVTYYYPYKYKSSGATNLVTEYNTILRLSEQYLIRSEARAEMGNLNGSIDDVDIIRKRAGLTLIKNVRPNITRNELLNEIQNENQLEFFTEWGHRWLDLKRTNSIDNVMNLVTPKKDIGGIWNSYQQLYPVNLGELQKNPRLVQNAGY